MEVQDLQAFCADVVAKRKTTSTVNVTLRKLVATKKHRVIAVAVTVTISIAAIFAAVTPQLTISSSRICSWKLELSLHRPTKVFDTNLNGTSTTEQ